MDFVPCDLILSMKDVPIIGYAKDEYGVHDDIVTILSSGPCPWCSRMKKMCKNCEKKHGKITSEYKMLEMRIEHQWKTTERLVELQQDNIETTVATLICKTFNALILRLLANHIHKDPDEGHRARCRILHKHLLRLYG